ncbi:MAG: hypothetical protein J0L81_15880 [Caulobacterales bacterium]|jgi:hypothetical protein|nr:hypothetical protein [Caulobacterales bacterium]
MRSLVLAALALGFASSAVAQTETIVARPLPNTTPTLPPNAAASYPREVSRGDPILDLTMQGPARRTFTDMAPNEMILERMTLGAGGDVYCGAGAASAAAAALITEPQAPATCFEDTDNDGAADRMFAVRSANEHQWILGQPEQLPTPRAWADTPGETRQMSFRYGGPTMGRVLEGGRIGEGAVEVNVLVISEAGARPGREPLLVPCLSDGRCMPMPLGENLIIMISNPTVEGEARVEAISRDAARAVLRDVQAWLATQRATSTPTAPPAREGDPSGDPNGQAQPPGQ